MAKWKVIADKNVQHIWKCPDFVKIGCKETATVSPEWYQNNGTPVCGKCDSNMEYVKTRIKE